MRCSSHTLHTVHREFMGVAEHQRPRLDITWNEREAVVLFGAKKYAGTLFDLPCITETYKMASKVHVTASELRVSQAVFALSLSVVCC